MSASAGSVLDTASRVFVQQVVSMVAASRTRDHLPVVARATGCRVLDDGRLVVLLPASRSRLVLQAVQESSTLAVVFSEPMSHRTIQLKGTDARATTIDPDVDVRVAQKYGSAFAARLVGLGYCAPMATALINVESDDLAAIVFTPAALYDQTPGPRAGRQLSTST